ncbi:heavy metal translocating P-type ATPase [Pseudonocardia sp. GCM10023141]|uniref:heavy metal translocating P-type ATPase n=1 Tax=Pseudonocardia sp. GCM10023141 TaxID=3252653 RepID=UPI00360D6A89
MRALMGVPEVRWSAVSLVAFLVAVVLGLVGAPWLLVVAAYLVCCVAGGWEPAWAGLRALGERKLDVDLLMVVAAIAAAAIGQWFDGGLLMVIFATSGALEAVMTARTRAGITALLDIAPETATVLVNGVEREIPAVELVAGQEVVMRPGERIPGDGRVTEGTSEVDTAALTGEPVPVRRSVGDEVLAGTVNGTGVLRVLVVRDAADSVVAGIAAQVERAAATKSDRQLFIERVEQRYSIVVVAATLALLAVPLLLGADFTSTLLRAMTFMIVASPCAIVLATMPPLLAAIAVAGRRGVLVKDATVMEALAEIDTVVLDKTGTLTTGRPQVITTVPITSHDGPAANVDIDAVLAVAAAAEAGSEHVLGQAVRRHALDRGLVVPDAADFAAIPGEGVRARVGTAHVLVGRPEILPTRNTVVDTIVNALQNDGQTAVVVVINDAAVAVIGLADEPRAGAADAVSALRQVVDDEPEILTGDADRPAQILADRVGIRRVHSGLLPAGKVDHVQARQAHGRHVLAAGDGLNDSPLLACADVGLVVGEGAGALTVEAADGVLTRDPLANLAPMIKLARRARRISRANLAFAATVIVGLVGWDLLDTLPLALGVAGHELSTVIVCLNGLRLLAGARHTQSRKQTASTSTTHPTPIADTAAPHHAAGLNPAARTRNA